MGRRQSFTWEELQKQPNFNPDEWEECEEEDESIIVIWWWRLVGSMIAITILGFIYWLLEEQKKKDKLKEEAESEKKENEYEQEWRPTAQSPSPVSFADSAYQSEHVSRIGVRTNSHRTNTHRKIDHLSRQISPAVSISHQYGASSPEAFSDTTTASKRDSSPDLCVRAPSPVQKFTEISEVQKFSPEPTSAEERGGNTEGRAAKHETTVNMSSSQHPLGFIQKPSSRAASETGTSITGGEDLSIDEHLRKVKLTDDQRGNLDEEFDVVKSKILTQTEAAMAAIESEEEGDGLAGGSGDGLKKIDSESVTSQNHHQTKPFPSDEAETDVIIKQKALLSLSESSSDLISSEEASGGQSGQPNSTTDEAAPPMITIDEAPGKMGDQAFWAGEEENGSTKPTDVQATSAAASSQVADNGKDASVDMEQQPLIEARQENLVQSSKPIHTATNKPSTDAAEPMTKKAEKGGDEPLKSSIGAEQEQVVTDGGISIGAEAPTAAAETSQDHGQLKDIQKEAYSNKQNEEDSCEAQKLSEEIQKSAAVPSGTTTAVAEASKEEAQKHTSTAKSKATEEEKSDFQVPNSAVAAKSSEGQKNEQSSGTTAESVKDSSKMPSAFQNTTDQVEEQKSDGKSVDNQASNGNNQEPEQVLKHSAEEQRAGPRLPSAFAASNEQQTSEQIHPQQSSAQADGGKQLIKGDHTISTSEQEGIGLPSAFRSQPDQENKRSTDNKDSKKENEATNERMVTDDGGDSAQLKATTSTEDDVQSGARGKLERLNTIPDTSGSSAQQAEIGDTPPFPVGDKNSSQGEAQGDLKQSKQKGQEVLPLKVKGDVHDSPKSKEKKEKSKKKKNDKAPSDDKASSEKKVKVGGESIEAGENKDEHEDSPAPGRLSNEKRGSTPHSDSSEARLRFAETAKPYLSQELPPSSDEDEPSATTAPEIESFAADPKDEQLIVEEEVEELPMDNVEAAQKMEASSCSAAPLPSTSQKSKSGAAPGFGGGSAPGFGDKSGTGGAGKRNKGKYPTTKMVGGSQNDNKLEAQPAMKKEKKEKSPSPAQQNENSFALTDSDSSDQKLSSVLEVIGVSSMAEALKKIETLNEVSTIMRKAGLETSNLIFAFIKTRTRMRRINILFGIDYTASNKYQGEKCFDGRSLHSINKDVLNPYQQVITIMGKTLAPFATSGTIPVFGFGDVHTSDWSVFPLKKDSYCTSFDEVLSVYNAVTPKTILSGPTNFAPLIYQALDICKQVRDYHILVIVADGQVTNERATRRAIVDACKFPLSIIVVGVGDGPWDMMRVFDDSLPKRPWDNFHFVEFHKIMEETLASSDLSFAVQSLLEIPDQYKKIKQLGLID